MEKEKVIFLMGETEDIKPEYRYSYYRDRAIEILMTGRIPIISDRFYIKDVEEMLEKVEKDYLGYLRKCSDLAKKKGKTAFVLISMLEIPNLSLGVVPDTGEYHIVKNYKTYSDDFEMQINNPGDYEIYILPEETGYLMGLEIDEAFYKNIMPYDTELPPTEHKKIEVKHEDIKEIYEAAVDILNVGKNMDYADIKAYMELETQILKFEKEIRLSVPQFLLVNRAYYMLSSIEKVNVLSKKEMAELTSLLKKHPFTTL